ncbi:TetR/AcrR family transcriptional regulator [Nocardioides lijunqiniae]|uniref:TetR/AcrR family transcriptional regulator n=1 Tax=Nocardioides lijunqiniae TaxID=2760832 RepID=UPI001878C087|nr:TetR/AcrR family transcriptional regulator [Nocardioides lijunqiniae]
MPRPADAALRDRIVGTAAALFYERGVRAVGLAEIVAAAGCGKNALYRHFPSKEALVLAYLREMATRLDATMDGALAGLDRVPSAALVALTRQVADWVADPGYRGCPFRSYLREVREDDHAPARLAEVEVQRLRARVDTLVADLGTSEPDVLAERIWLVLEGLYASAPYGDPQQSATTAVGLVQDLLAAA